MAKLSFRRPLFRVYPRASSLICFTACAFSAAALSGCGGGKSHPSERLVRAATFTFQTPYDWKVFRSAKTHTVSAASEPGAPAFVAVAVLPTTKPYSPELFAKAVPELDRTAEQLAGLQKGTVESRATIPVLGERVRQYVIAFEKDGTQLRQRVTFFLRGRLNYELACQWKASDSEPPACSQLTETFRLI